MTLIANTPTVKYEAAGLFKANKEGLLTVISAAATALACGKAEAETFRVGGDCH